VTFFYLEFEDLFFVIGLAAVMNIVGRFLNRELNGIPLGISCSSMSSPDCRAGADASSSTGSRRGYLRDSPARHTKPHVYCGLEPDRGVHFPNSCVRRMSCLVTAAKHEESLRRPALCELLPVREYWTV
jgi:hypothetical protein